MARLIEYVPTEAELRQLVGGQWPDKLIRDYLTIKFNSGNVNNEVISATTEITNIKGDVVTINGQITSITTRLTTAEGNIVTLTSNLSAHVNATSAHGATGDIVGTGNFCTPSVGGTVLLAGAQVDANPSDVTPPAALGAASATYVQAEQQAQTDTINALENNIVTLRSDLNAAIAVINNMLATERTAKQRAT